MLDGLTFDIQISDESRKRTEALLAGIDGAAAKVLSKSLNAGMGVARREMIKRASQTTGLSPATIRERVWGKRSSATDLWARARAGKRGWPLNLWPHRQEAYGVRVDMPGGSFLFPHMFVGHGVIAGLVMFHKVPGQQLPMGHGVTDSVTAALLRAGAEPEIVERGRAKTMETLESETQKMLTGNATEEAA